MIKTKQDLSHFLEEDKKVYGKSHMRKFSIREFLLPDANWKFMKLLRKFEYHYNNHHKIRAYVYNRKYTRQGLKIGVVLPPNVVGRGCHITHGKFVANGEAKIGENCKIFDNVTVGGTGRYDLQGAPTIGNRVVLCCGARVIGKVTIADDVVVAANAVVVTDVLESGITVGGVPAKKISENGAYNYLNKNS